MESDQAGASAYEAQMNPRRRTLVSTVSCLLNEIAIDSADNASIETLTEVIESLIVEIGSSSRSYCELSGRTEPVIGDVIMALVNMGLSLEGIEQHAYRSNASVLAAPLTGVNPKTLNILQAGVKQSHPCYIPTHLPFFPDPHAYIRTPTHKQPVTEYEAIREKAANQKRDVERALTRFVAKTSETHSLFLSEDNNMFPLIACNTQFPVYLKALLPSDQVFDFEEEFPSSPQRSRKCRETEEDGEEIKEGEESGKGESDVIDNPYLRPVKVPRKKKKSL
ncbi:hypothetical protein R5R35_006356 [Gryllus longicercus]|uniref:Transcription initiation factor TFIID subunit 8 n=1 Tax=Gryllus longicercus TaxID=2509291 RepID=A0AAN9VX31_9ORTH